MNGTRACLVLALLQAPLLFGADVVVLKSAETPAWRPALEAMRRVASAHAFTEFDLRGDKAEADRVLGATKARAALFVAMGPFAAQVAHESAPDIPLVVCMIQDPSRIGVQAAPNVSGVSYAVPIKNQLAAFRLVNPRGVRVGVVYNADNVGRVVQDALKAAPVVRLALVEKAVASEREVPAALRALLTGSDAVDALWLPPDPMLLGDEARRFIFAETLKAGKPVYTFSPALVSEGALVSDGPDMVSTGEEVGDLVNRLLGAEKGARIEFQIPRAELVINKKIADRLKVEISAEALKSASKVY